MTDEILYLDLDYMPPTAARLFELPPLLGEAGINTLCIKILSSFPWEFEERMRADSYLPENVISHFFKLCDDYEIRIWFVFPSPGDFSRLLRLPGYLRLACDNCKFPILNPESTGMRSFIESIVEDVVSLVPHVDYFLTQSHESGENSSKDLNLYRSIVDNGVKACGYNSRSLPQMTDFKYLEDIFDQYSQSGIPTLNTEMKKSTADFEITAFRIRQYAVMSSLGCSAPAAGWETPAEMYRHLELSRTNLGGCIELLRSAATPFVDELWLKSYLTSIEIAVDEDFGAAKTRLKPLGIFKDT